MRAEQRTLVVCQEAGDGLHLEVRSPALHLLGVMLSEQRLALMLEWSGLLLY